jgi:transcriptional regulator with XRE-family HTH domain
LQSRVAALKSELGSRHPESIRYLEWLALASEGEGRWFVDSRGSNDFMGCQAIASFGVPYQNLGYLQALYQTLTGQCVALDRQNPDPDFQAFVDAHTQSEITQAIGRLRSHIRPDEQLTYYFCGDYDLGFLDVPVEQIEAFAITPQAGSATQQGRWALLEAVKEITEAGKKLTQATLATAAGISQGRVSQRAAEVGGWGTLKKLLGFLLRSLYSNPNNFEPLAEDELWLAKTYLPLALLEADPSDAIRHVADLVKISDCKTFEAILAAVPLESKAKLLGLIIGFMPESVQAQIQSLAMDEAIA